MPFPRCSGTKGAGPAAEHPRSGSLAQTRGLLRASLASPKSRRDGSYPGPRRQLAGRGRRGAKGSVKEDVGRVPSESPIRAQRTGLRC